MATLTVEINKDKDLSELTELIARLGLTYKVETDKDLLYSDDFRAELDKRYKAYQEGVVDLISAENSKKQIQELLATKK